MVVVTACGVVVAMSGAAVVAGAAGTEDDATCAGNGFGAAETLETEIAPPPPLFAPELAPAEFASGSVEGVGVGVGGT